MGVKVLSALDKAQTQCYHFQAILIAGMGFFTDAYDLFCIPPISNLLGRLYYDNSTQLPPLVNSAVNGVALFGAFAGQLFFGWLGDRMGRKKVYGITLAFMVASSILSGFSLGSTRESVVTCLCFFRFWLGFGIGGDYPLSATIMAEYANTKTRGAFIASVFAMQGVGILAASAVAVIVSAPFKSELSHPTWAQQDMVWRMILMFGAIPAGLTFYWRMKMPETARYTALVAKDTKQAVADMARVLLLNIEEDDVDVFETREQKQPFGLFSRDFLRLHGRQLVGTASTWFFVDIAFYSNNLFQKDIYKSVGWLKTNYGNPVDEVFHIARAQALIALFAMIPGYLFAILLVDRIGRFRIQLAGFFFMSVFMFVLAFHYDKYWCDAKHMYGFLVIYSLTFFFANFGPNTTTFIVPAELFPARLRSTCHGISAAAGKAGAMIGVFAFIYAAQPNGIGMDRALVLLGLAACLGFLFTFLIPETKGRSLETNEEQLSTRPLSQRGFSFHYTEESISDNL